MIDFTGHTIGRYKILERIGQGGMAVVYKALDTRLGNEVALKFIKKEEFPASAQEGMLQRFEREARLMASLNHPNIVKVMDYGEYEGYPYLVMPYLSGGTLKARMGKPIPWREAVRIILPLTQALEYAHKHQKGALHRDIKPSNILMTESSEPVLTDFGIAKILEKDDQHTLTGTGTGMGTPEYMAPEQWVKKEVDGRADVYALGTVMYELFTGRQPYKADTPAAVMLKQATEPLPRPRMLVTDLPEKVEQVVLKALAKEPDNRYPSMGEYGKALESLTAEPKPFKLPKWVKPVLIGLLVVGMLTSCIAWLVIPGVGRIQTYLVERGQTATAQAEELAAESTQTAIAAAWTATPSPEPSPIIPSETISLSVPPDCTEIGQEWVSPVDGMTLVCVPAGSFAMGSGSGDEDEKPAHMVNLNAYWMDQTEVTNEQYVQCVAAGACTVPESSASHTRIAYYGTSEYANYPIIYVDWNQAEAYCRWAGRELPTEAQWEKAAAGKDKLFFPWGYDSSICDRANFGNDCGRDTSAVGSYPTGASPYGALDMAGNVWEWIADWYGPYPSGKQTNPTGPTSGEYRVIRGGSWDYFTWDVSTHARNRYSPNTRLSSLGFRCSRSLESTQTSATDANVQNTTEIAATKLKVCQVTDTMGIDDKSFNATTWKGVVDAQAQFVIEGHYLESQEVTDYEKNINTFLADKCDLIIASSWYLGDAIKAAAETNPSAKFSIVDNEYATVIPNILSQSFQVDEAAFLAGYLAAGVTKTGKIATYGGYPIPTITIFMDGFARGAAYYNEKHGTAVKVIGWDSVDPNKGLFSYSFDDQTKGEELAIPLMNEGVDIIMPVAGSVSLGTAAVMQERGTGYLIGVDTDWFLTSPDYANLVLTSVIKNMDVTTLAAIKMVKDDAFKGGSILGNLANNGVGLAPFHNLDSIVSSELRGELENVKADILAGKVKTR